MKGFTLEFNPTGKGYVECKRTRHDGSPAGVVNYYLGGLQPLGLDSEQFEEYWAARELELENAK